MKLSHVTIVANGLKSESERLAGEIETFLGERGIRNKTIMTYQSSAGMEIPYETDLVISLGGDGTVLSVARKVHELGRLILPVNLGTFGYITEISKDEWREELENLMDGKSVISRRLMLRVAIERKGRRIFSSYALNEAAISSSGTSKVVKLELFLDKTRAGIFKADGLIVATPTGSTGYSLSCGGPIISPSASMTLMTPIAPHTLNTRSIIFPAEDEIGVEIAQGTHRGNGKAVASFDGDTNIAMNVGDRIVIRRSVKDTRIIKISNISFLEVLRTKMRD